MIDILWPTDHPSDYRWVPDTSTFGARLALVRQRMGWNLKEAALACQLPQGSWREWELKRRKPPPAVRARGGCLSAVGAAGV